MVGCLFCKYAKGLVSLHPGVMEDRKAIVRNKEARGVKQHAVASSSLRHVKS